MIVSSSSEVSPDAIRIHPHEIHDRGEWVRVSYRVDGLNAPELWFDFDAEYRDFFSESSDSALAALLAAAMTAQKPLHLEGPVSARLVWHINNTVLPVMLRQIPIFKPVPVTVAEVRPDWERVGSGVLTGFSCGVDSLSVIQDHFLDETVPAEERVTHLLFSHVGHHGTGHDVHEIADRRGARVREAAEAVGLPLLRVYSNTPEFYTKRYDARLSWITLITLRNSSVPLLLQRGFRRFLAGSSHSWDTIGVGPTHDMSKADPILLPALGTERTELCSVGSEHTRVEKTRRIADMELTREYLDVCIMEGGHNCSRCEKCLRTALTLEVMGALEPLEDRFDLEEYRRHRDDFTARILAEKRDPFHREIQELMAEEGFQSPLKVRGQAALLDIWRVLPVDFRRKLRGRPKRPS